MPNKLQKRTSPAYPGLGTNTTTLQEGGIRYESLPQDTRQPVPLNESYHQVAVSGALASRYFQSPVQPYRDQTEQSRRTLSQQISSPVSPLMDVPAPEQGKRASLPPTQIHAPQPQRKSVELRRLDGSPYEPDRPKQVMVARDMHEGAKPPAYKRQASETIPPPLERPVFPNSPSSRPGSSHHDCSKCGKQKNPDSGSRPGTSYSTVSVTPAHNCGKCGKRKTSSSSPAPSAPHSRVASASAPLMPAPYVAPAAAPSRGMTQPTSPTVAGPSQPRSYPPSSFPGAEQPSKCHKCGKKKKPFTAPLPQNAFGNTYPTPPSSAPLNRGPMNGLSISPSRALMRGPQIDIVPPSATTYRPTSLQSATTFGDNAPLVGNRHSRQQSGGVFRNNSLVRSLSRRLSSRSKHESQGPLPSQQLRANQPENGTGNLINMISNAIKGNGADQRPDQDYQKLHAAGEPVDRPASPFSFMSANQEDETFEMVDMDEKNRQSGSTAVGSAGSPKGKETEVKSPDSVDSMYSPVAIGETMDPDVDRRSRDMRASAERRSAERRDPDMLAVPQYGAGSRPPITRFKSLREGVSRAASVSRQSSLRRMESLKKVPSAWYRDDMAIEGHNGESQGVLVY
jgi:hypothetical protein